MTANLTTMALLAHLKIEMLGMKAKDSDATHGANKYFNVTDTAGDYQKCKIARADVADILRFAGQARAAHRKFAMPFLNNGYRIIPAKMVLKYTQEMSIHKTNFEQAVQDLVVRWPNVVASAQQRLVGSLFNPDDYPAQNAVANCYSIEFILQPIPNQSHIVLELEQELVDDLKQQLEAQNTEALQRTMADVWRRLYEPVQTMSEVFGQDKKVFASVIGNIERIVELLPMLNLANDPRVTEMANDIKARLLQHPVAQIKKDASLKAHLAAEAQAILSKMATVQHGHSTLQ